MKNILDELYEYDFFHPNDVVDNDSEYMTAVDRLVKAEAELKKAYPEKCELFDAYQSADIELHHISNRNEFRIGFKAGAQLILEIINPIM